MGVMRKRKDGMGCSICNASPENVGKRRCCHIISDADMEVRNVRGIGKVVEITGNVGGERTKVSIQADEENLCHYIKNLSKGLPKKEREGVSAIMFDIINEMTGKKK